MHRPSLLSRHRGWEKSDSLDQDALMSYYGLQNTEVSPSIPCQAERATTNTEDVHKCAFPFPDNQAIWSRDEDQTTTFVLCVLVDYEVLSWAQQYLCDVTVHRVQASLSNANQPFSQLEAKSSGKTQCPVHLYTSCPRSTDGSPFARTPSSKEQSSGTLSATWP